MLKNEIKKNQLKNTKNPSRAKFAHLTHDMSYETTITS